MLEIAQFVEWTGAVIDPAAPPGDVKQVIDAVNAYVDDLPVVADNGGKWSRQVDLGAVMLAARLYSRRNTANGVEALDINDISYVSRYDPDIPVLLRTGIYHKPVLG